MKHLIRRINSNYMQSLKLLSAIIFSTCLLQACSGNNSANAGKANAANENVSDASSLAGASFSCKIGGKDFSGSGTDGITNSFINSGGGVINFVLVSMAPGGKGIPTQMNFFVANTGTTTIRSNGDTNYSVEYSEQTSDHAWECKDMIVSVTPSGASRITGTFSGTFVDPNTNEILPVTDGKFDLPSLNVSGK
ncbi:MAG: hypothetical protein ABI683_11265 [Ginsengibacter sp.]